MFDENGYFGPPPMPKRVHRGKLVRSDGAVVPLCRLASKRVCNEKDETWTNRDAAVTCQKCRKALAAAPRDEPGTGGGK